MSDRSIENMQAAARFVSGEVLAMLEKFLSRSRLKLAVRRRTSCGEGG
jgi:hypothetical protein